MKVFFGAAIQGLQKRGERSHVYRALIETIKISGHRIVSEHTVSDSTVATAKLLEESIGPLPPVGVERNIYVRDKMIQAIESPELGAAIFEVSTPSLGTGIEIAHAYLRPKMGLQPIPILILYETDYWENRLSSMIQGLTKQSAPNVTLKHFSTIQEAQTAVSEFLAL